MRDKWGDSVFRNVVPTPDFSLPSEENIGETHKKVAKTRRGANLLYSQDQLKIEDQSLFAQTHIHPLIFEECYVNDADQKFVNMVKNSSELTEAKIMIKNEMEGIE